MVGDINGVMVGSAVVDNISLGTSVWVTGLWVWLVTVTAVAVVSVAVTEVCR